MTYANSDDPPEEYRGESALGQFDDRATEDREASFGIAWGDPNGSHKVYDWPYTFDQMGLVIQSYQNYSGGTSSAYFHHGIDMIAPNGTQVFTRSGGQVVNIENYQRGNDLYWEVAILDPEGYVWQYHHVDKTTIPQLIHTKFAEWRVDPDNGGYVPPDTHIGNIVYWPVVSMGYRFNHIHLNILAAGDRYLNTLEFHEPIEDNQAPEIQEIGLLNGNTIVRGNTVSSGNYGLYVRARDLFKSDVYYLPPYKTEFSVDGGVWTTVWEFHDLPGGSSDTRFLHDYFVPGYTKGDYNNRDFYINLGFIPGSQYQFPTAPGTHTIDVRVWDYAGNSTTDSFTWIIEGIPDDPDNCVQIPVQADTFLQQTNTNYNWGGNNLIYARRNITINERALHPLLKWDLSSIPQDAQVTSAEIALRVTQSTTSIFNLYYLKQGWIEGRLSGAVSNSSANWSTYNGINAWGAAGAQSTTLDRNNSNLWNATSSSYNATGVRTITLNSTGVGVVQSWVDKSLENYGMTIQPTTGSGTLTFASKEHTQYQSPTLKVCFDYSEPTNQPPTALSQSVQTGMNVPVSIILTGTDEDGDPLSFRIISGPSHGQLTGDLNQSRSTISYAPDYGYRGEDSFSFVANDGSVDSEPATVSIWVYDPTSADLVSFEGAYKNGKNRIFWEINNPNDFLRFDLYRATSADGERIKRNEEMIFSTDRVYELFDHEIVLGQLYFYWLKCYDLYGNEIYKPYDPIEVRSGFQGFIPMIVN
ncbi:MAG: Ig-like domain-containing protein [Brevefilum sp.]